MSDTSFVLPQYGSRCFADLPGAVLSWLTGTTNNPTLSKEITSPLADRYDQVVLLYLDGFGWRFVESFLKRSPLLQRIGAEGILTPITSQFPSTTAAHVTAIHTGLPVGQSGVFEWQYYEPTLDAVIASLLFSFAGDKQRDTLKTIGVDAAQLYPKQTLYNELKRHGVRSTVLQHRAYTPSTYSNIVLKGAKVIPYATLPEALVLLRRLLSKQTGPAYHVLYFDNVDDICHRHGPGSVYAEAETDALLTLLDRFLFQALEPTVHRTLFVLTSDHGQVEVSPKTAVYLNQDRRFEGFDRFLRKNAQGKLLAPAGSPRDFFLYVQEEYLEEALTFFSDRLEGTAVVRRVSDLISEGYFGPLPCSDVFLSRVGNLVILPYAGESVWWYEKDRFQQRFFGHHGGLTAQEIVIPLMLYPVE